MKWTMSVIKKSLENSSIMKISWHSILKRTLTLNMITTFNHTIGRISFNEKNFKFKIDHIASLVGKNPYRETLNQITSTSQVIILILEELKIGLPLQSWVRKKYNNPGKFL